ncbi:uncharacterized protein L199_007454 [Kwoniella botswanensis]|uniref:uncharacterized protein n=1 Tax=Kwoniella botswanensis TaxID=1268659 RepID=UPI00315C89B5
MRLSPPAPVSPRPTLSKSIPINSPEKPLEISHWKEQWKNLVQFLSVKQHVDTWCHFSHPRQLDLPNLKVLQIDAQRNKDNSWTSSDFHRWSSNINNQFCPLLKGLRPKVAIIRNVGNTPFEAQCRGVPIRTWTEVETLIMISSSISQHEHLIYRHPPPGLINLQKVIWICDPQAFRSTPSGPLLQPLISSETSIYTGYVLLSHLLQKFVDVPITIVNLGPSARYRLYSSVSADLEDGELTSEDVFRHNLTHLVENTSTPIRKDDLPRKQGLIGFMSLEEFLEKENWKDWFEEEEMMNWVDIMGKHNGQEEIEG